LKDLEDIIGSHQRKKEENQQEIQFDSENFQKKSQKFLKKRDKKVDWKKKR
jgi:hypothetical protein